jgi:hypothetical protein
MEEDAEREIRGRRGEINVLRSMSDADTHTHNA